jgi:hypothetical protein
MEKLMKEVKRELNVSSTKECKEKVTKEMKELGLSKIDIIYHISTALSNIILKSIIWTFALFFFYHFDDITDWHGRSVSFFSIKTIIELVVIFCGCFLFFLLLTLFGIVDFVFHYRLDRAISFRFLKDIKKYGIIKELSEDLKENKHSRNYSTSRT